MKLIWLALWQTAKRIESMNYIFFPIFRFPKHVNLSWHNPNHYYYHYSFTRQLNQSLFAFRGVRACETLLSSDNFFPSLLWTFCLQAHITHFCGVYPFPIWFRPQISVTKLLCLRLPQPPTFPQRMPLIAPGGRQEQKRWNTDHDYKLDFPPDQGVAKASHSPNQYDGKYLSGSALLTFSSKLP